MVTKLLTSKQAVCEINYLGRISGDVVEDVDENEEEGDEERHPTGNDVWRDEEGNPRHHLK